jgi:hypothetical protein
MNRRTLTLLATFSLVVSSPSFAKPPALTALFPAGAARGQVVTVTATGSFDHWPVTPWVEGAGLSIEAGAKKAELTFRVDSDAEPGVHWIRLHDEEGATALRPFIVGTLPEIVEIEPNDAPESPQVVTQPAMVVNGRLARRGDVDGFGVALTKGQLLVANLEANRHLGSPMDAVLQVVSSAGFVLAQNDDAIGRDPQIHFTAPADDTYTVRLFAFPETPDSSIAFAGGDSFIYRLTLTTGGFLEGVFPLAVSRENATAVEAIGPNIPEAARLLPVDTKGDPRDLLRLSHTLLAGTADVQVVSFPALVEIEPGDPANPQTLPVPCALSGRIDPSGDQDTFHVALKKGDQRVFRVQSHSLGLPLDPVLRVSDGEGKTLAEADDVDQARDPELTFIAPADGGYRIHVQDLNGRGGARFAYLLQVLVPEPDFDVSLATDRFDLTPGTPTKIAITVTRRSGFTGPIEIVAEGLPEGVSALPQTSKTGDSSEKAVTLEIGAERGAHSGPFRVLARSTADPARSRVALAPITELKTTTSQLWLAILPPPPSAKP